MRLIPGKTKVKMELFRGVTLSDVIVSLVGLGIAALCAVSSLPYRWIIALIVAGIFGMTLVRVNDNPIYIFFWYMLRYQAYPRKYARVYDDKALARLSGDRQEAVDAFYEEDKEEVSEEQKQEEEKNLKEILKEEKRILKSKTATEEEKNAVWLARAERTAQKKKKKAQNKDNTSDYDDISNLMPFTGIKDKFIEYAGQYFGAVIEIDPVEFRFFSKIRRDNSIEQCLGKILRSLSGEYGANIVKLQRPIMYDRYLEMEYGKLDSLKKSYESGLLTEDELKARTEIEFARISEIDDLCTDNMVVESFYYLVLFDRDRRKLNSMMNQAINSLAQGELEVRRLDDRGLAIFLKYSNTLDFDERQIDEIPQEHWVDWAMPEMLRITSRRIEVNKMITHNLRVISYPSTVGDAWLAGVMSFPGSKVIVKTTPMDRAKSIRAIDRSLAELRARYNATGVDSRRLELQEHIETLSSLLVTLQQENEALMSVNIYVTAYDAMATKEDPMLNDGFKTLMPMVPDLKKTLRHTWAEAGMKLNGMDFLQIQSFIGSQVSPYDPMLKEARGIPTNTIAGMYPWIFAHVSDEGGVKLGSSDGVPVFINFFRRDSERVNSNMVIVGKSGSGKSYTTKSLLLNLASEDSKIFILDPENEYSELAHNLHGKIINVGNATYGRLNPFHIITALDDDEAGETGGPAGSFATHLQFLEEFFRQILPDIDRDALEYLNSLVERVYLNFGITAETDLSRLHAEDYPIFDDLYDVVLAEFERTNNDYLRQLLRSLVNYISKFSTGGRNANIWNGPSTITTDENFSVFNFQSLLANRNSTIANAQMLLVLKYVDNEIIKNRDYNLKYNLNRKVVVVIDEAHVFIDTKFPVALDFMFQLAKRIRKYNGMQIVITQNIKDFVGSEEIARKSTAIINACQYSFVFGLAPNDMDDLCRLYEKAGGINEQEQEDILNAKRGQAFAIMSPSSRTSFHIDVPELFVDMFENGEHENYYFSGEEGEEAWEDYISDSRDSHDANYDERIEYEAEHPGLQEQKGTLKFSEISFGEEIDLTSEAEAGEAGSEEKEVSEREGSKERKNAMDRLIEAEAVVNQRDYEMATLRFGGIQLTEEMAGEPEAKIPEPEPVTKIGGGSMSFGGITLEEVDGATADAEAAEERRRAEEAERQAAEEEEERAEARREKKRAKSRTAAARSAASDADVDIDTKLEELRRSIRAEMEQELMEKLKWISIGMGLGSGTDLSGLMNQPAAKKTPGSDEDYDPGKDLDLDEDNDDILDENLDLDEDYDADPGEEDLGLDEDYAEEQDAGEEFADDDFDYDADLDEDYDADLDEDYDADLDEDYDADLGETPDLTDEDLGLDDDLDLDEDYDADPDAGEEFSDDDFDYDADLDEGYDVDLDADLGLTDEDLDEDYDLDSDDDEEYSDDDFDYDADLDDEDEDMDYDADLDLTDDDYELDDADLDDIDLDADLEELGLGYDSDEDEEDDDYEHTPFLFAELLAEAAEEYADMSLEERMEESGEDVMEISLDELSSFIRDRKKKKGE